MGDIIDFEKWKQENPRLVNRTRKIREHSRDTTEQGALKEFVDPTQLKAELTAGKILGNEDVVKSFVSISRNANVEQLRTRYISQTTTELAGMIQRGIEKGEDGEDIYPVEDWRSNALHFCIAAEVYLDKMKREKERVSSSAVQ